jgi:capsular exopolysaccharide synthesis family protein
MITSALTSEGKSTTSSNLGVSFAQLGFKILLVDVDLRKPALHKHLSIPQEPGLLNILLNDIEWESMIHDTYLANLKVIPAGGIPSNPSELLGNQRMKRFLKEASEIFDFVILDAPVILSISDVEVLSSEIDGILLIHNANKSDKRTTMEAKKILERSMSNIIGMVINNISQSNDIYGYSKYEMYYGRNILDKNEGRKF